MVEDKVKTNIEESFKMRVDRAEKLRKLQDNSDFIFFLEIIRGKQQQFKNVCLRPSRIGKIMPIKDQTGKVLDYVKYDGEEDIAKIKEAQYRYDTFNQILHLIDDFVRDGKIASEQLNKIVEVKNPKNIGK